MALAALASVPGCGGSSASAGPSGSTTSTAGQQHRCDLIAHVVGDSRRTLEIAVLPRTTDRMWATQLGIRGDASGRHVAYASDQGAVHEDVADALDALMARCLPGERPLVFDFMGTNYAQPDLGWIVDPAVAGAIDRTILDFYDRHAPDARVVLAELTLSPNAPDATTRRQIAEYLDTYNGALRRLARAHPDRFFFLPAPEAYRDGTITWRDLRHETFEAPLAEYEGKTPAGALDRTASQVIAAGRGNPCALFLDPRFGGARYSEAAALGAYLQDFRASSDAQAWLHDPSVAPEARIELADHTIRCRY